MNTSAGPSLRPEVSSIERERVRAQVKASMFGRPSEPIMVGRYAIRSRIGGGGQGDVYDAYDPALDRHVALKVLRRGPVQREREARALARIDHPNIVRVFGTGLHHPEGGAAAGYIVTERVRGETLDRWLQRDPTPRQRLQLLLGCAEGLQAAHEAGVVHADFKPSNVLVEGDGTPRIIDFGIAGSDHHTAPLGGTPGWVAPEQEDGRVLGPAVDQYSLCVVAEEVLAQTSSRRRLRAVLRRGRAHDPHERHASMSPIVDALRRELSAASSARTWLTVGAVAVALVGGGLAVPSRASTPDCNRTAQVDALRTRLDASAPTASSWLDGWVSARERSCLQAARGTAPRACLDDALASFESLLDAYVGGDRDMLVSMLSTEPAHVCLEVASEHRDEGDVLRRAQAADARGQHDTVLALTANAGGSKGIEASRLLELRARALDRRGHTRAAIETLEAATWQAADVRSRAVSLACRLVAWHGEAGDLEAARRWFRWAQERAGTSSEETAWLARARSFLLHAEGNDAAAFEAAVSALPEASGIDEAHLLRRACVTSDLGGGRADTVLWCERAATAYEALLGADHPTTLAAKQSLGIALEGAARYAEAQTLLESVVEATRRDPTASAVGLVTVLNSLGIVREQREDYAGATQAYEEALRGLEGLPDPQPVVTAKITLNLGTLMAVQERPLEALRHYQRARVLFEEHLGQQAPELVWVRWGLGNAYLDLERFDDARDELSGAVERAEALELGPVTVGKIAVSLARAQVGDDFDPDAGRRWARRAVDLLMEHAPDAERDLADARKVLDALGG